MSSNTLCKRKLRPENVLFNVFEKLDLEPYKKIVLQDRYLTVLRNFHLRANRLTYMFYISRITVTVGSILVPALLSVQMNTETIMFWTAWVISICVTICNGLITLFKLDKKYYFIHTTLEMMHSEGWQYVGLSGRYSNRDTPSVIATHDNQFLIFFHMAEKIKMRQVEEEYWKFTDTTGVGNATNYRPTGLIQTPVTIQGTLASLPPVHKAIIEGWIDEMKQSSGIQPRTIKEDSRIDGPKSPPSIRRPSTVLIVPVQHSVQGSPTSESTVVQIPQLYDADEKIYEDSPKEGGVLQVP